MLFQSLQTLLKVQNGFLMKEKELIERIQNYTFNVGVTLIINNNTYYTNRELTSSVICCCNKVNFNGQGIKYHLVIILFLKRNILI